MSAAEWVPKQQHTHRQLVKATHALQGTGSAWDVSSWVCVVVVSSNTHSQFGVLACMYAVATSGSSAKVRA
jgi:hypothetical protein